MEMTAPASTPDPQTTSNLTKSKEKKQDVVLDRQMKKYNEVSITQAQLCKVSMYLCGPFSNDFLLSPLSFKFFHFIPHHFFFLCHLFTISSLNIILKIKLHCF